MKSYAILLLTLTVVLVGGSGLLLAGGSKSSHKQSGNAKPQVRRQADQAMLMRWQENRPSHWRSMVLHQN